MYIQVCIAHSHCLVHAKFVVSNNARQIHTADGPPGGPRAPPRPPVLPRATAGAPTTPGSTRRHCHPASLPFSRHGPSPALGANGGVVSDGLEEDEELGLEALRLGVGVEGRTANSSAAS